jgi:cholesterol transport system auxiliary component
MKTIPFAVSLALSLSACVSFGSKVPASLVTLSPATTLPSGTSRTLASNDAMTIAVPIAPQALASNRVAVSSGETAIAYVKDAQWAEPPARLFQRLLAETVSAKTGKLVLDPRQFSAASGMQMSGQLRNFGVVVETPGATSGTAVVTYDAAVSRDRGMKVTTQRFEARVQVSVIDAVSVGPALNTAANQVAVKVADWVATQ